MRSHINQKICFMSFRPLNIFTLVFLISCFSYSANAQFGISIKHAFDYEDIPSAVPNQTNERSLQHGGVIAMDYRVKIVDYGVNFGPEIFAKMIRAKGIPVNDVGGIELGKVKEIRSFGINIPVTMYVFHFNQCDECPSFKRKNFLKDNFFIQPVIGYEIRNWTTDPTDITENITEHFIAGGIGAGVNIMAGKIIRIAPIVQYKRNFSLTENALYKTKLQPSILEVGVRVGWGR